MPNPRTQVRGSGIGDIQHTQGMRCTLDLYSSYASLVRRAYETKEKVWADPEKETG